MCNGHKELKEQVIDLQAENCQLQCNLDEVIDLQAENCQLQCNLDECKTPKESQDYQDICSLNEGLEITNNQYKKNSLKLQALENLGVDDWDGYDDAMDDYRELLKSNCIEDD